MPTNRQRRTRKVKRSLHELTLPQHWSLRLGSWSRQSAFVDDAERRAAWEVHRSRLLAHMHPGSRPDAWWSYEAAETRNSRNTSAQLIAMGVCDDAEVAEIEKQWRWQDLIAHRQAASAVGRGSVFHEALASLRRERGIPTAGRPELDTSVWAD